eukprot:77864_1
MHIANSHLIIQDMACGERCFNGFVGCIDEMRTKTYLTTIGPIHPCTLRPRHGYDHDVSTTGKLINVHTTMSRIMEEKKMPDTFDTFKESVHFITAVRDSKHRKQRDRIPKIKWKSTQITHETTGNEGTRKVPLESYREDLSHLNQALIQTPTFDEDQTRARAWDCQVLWSVSIRYIT